MSNNWPKCLKNSSPDELQPPRKVPAAVAPDQRRSWERYGEGDRKWLQETGSSETGKGEKSGTEESRSKRGRRQVSEILNSAKLRKALMFQFVATFTWRIRWHPLWMDPGPQRNCVTQLRFEKKWFTFCVVGGPELKSFLSHDAKAFCVVVGGPEDLLVLNQ